MGGGGTLSPAPDVEHFALTLASKMTVFTVKFCVRVPVLFPCPAVLSGTGSVAGLSLGALICDTSYGHSNSALSRLFRGVS